MSRVLLVEDDDSIAIVITAALEAEGLVVTRCASIAERDRLLAGERFAVLATDVMLPDGDGIATMDAVRSLHPEMAVIVLSAQNTLDTAVRASGAGAYEYFPKPFDIDELAKAVRQAAGANANAGEGIDEEDGAQALPLVGRSAPMQAVYRMITRVLRNDLTVLILGESGTGKELVAEAIHQLGHRASGPFVAVNCAAIPAELIESELFGHEKGAFTGAHERRIGRFEQAQGGTLFLDEIGELPLELQPRLLRRRIQVGAAVRRINVVAHLQAHGQARGVAQQVDDAHRRVGGPGGPPARAAADVNAQVAPRRDEAVHRVVQRHQALLDQHHESHAGDRLGHRVDAREAVLGQRRLAPLGERPPQPFILARHQAGEIGAASCGTGQKLANLARLAGKPLPRLGGGFGIERDRTACNKAGKAHAPTLGLGPCGPQDPPHSAAGVRGPQPERERI